MGADVQKKKWARGDNARMKGYFYFIHKTTKMCKGCKKVKMLEILLDWFLHVCFIQLVKLMSFFKQLFFYKRKVQN